MATWTRTGASLAANSCYICSDGINIYFIDGDPDDYIFSGDVIKFDTSTDTDEIILDTSAWPGDSTFLYGLAIFKGSLYVAIRTEPTAASFEIDIMKWNGSSFDVVYNNFYSGGATLPAAIRLIRLYANDDQLVVAGIVIGFPDYGFTSKVIYSGDGTRWGVGTWAVDPIVSPNSNDLRARNGTSFPIGFYDYFCNSDTGAPLYLCDSQAIYLWDGVSNFAIWQATPHATALFETSPLGEIHWAQSLDQYFNLAYTVLTTLTPPVDIHILHQVNMQTSFGNKKLGAGSGAELYFLSDNPLAWNLLETINYLAFDPDFDEEATAIIKMANNDVYIVGYNTTSTFVEYWKRSEQLLYTLSGFFQDRDKITFRSELPVPSILPGGIHSVGKKVYVGTGEPASPVVAYAESENSFDSWTDYSGSLSTADAIKAFSGTPWGDSEDLESSEDPAGFQGGPSGKCS